MRGHKQASSSYKRIAIKDWTRSDFRPRPKSLHAMRAYYQRVCTSMTLYADAIGHRVTPDGSFEKSCWKEEKKRYSAGQVRVYWGYLRAMSRQGLASAVA